MNEVLEEEIRRLLGSNNKACYVLLSCDEPEADGHMQVQMTYEGDPTLAVYLLESARFQIEEQCALDLPDE
jgi:hypothetical protein